MISASHYFNHLEDCFRKGRETNELISKIVKIGPSLVRFNFLGKELLPIFFKAFHHLEVTQLREEDSIGLVINLWDVSSTGAAIISPPWKSETPHHLGLIESFSNEGIFTLQQPGSGAIYMYHEEKCQANYCVFSKQNIPYWESDFPLRMIFHWFFKNSSLQPVHSAVVGTHQGGLMLVGKGGSGKSTTTLSCLQSSLKIAGDDYVLIDTNTKRAYSLFNICKLSPQSLQLLKHKHIAEERLSGPIDGKFRIALEGENDMLHEVPIKAILLPQVSYHTETTIIPCSAAESLLALSPTTLFQLPGLRELAFKKMSDLVRSIPNYHLLLGSDIKQIPDILHQFIQSLNS